MRSISIEFNGEENSFLLYSFPLLGIDFQKHSTAFESMVFVVRTELSLQKMEQIVSFKPVSRKEELLK